MNIIIYRSPAELLFYRDPNVYLCTRLYKFNKSYRTSSNYPIIIEANRGLRGAHTDLTRHREKKFDLIGQVDKRKDIEYLQPVFSTGKTRHLNE